jgi:hypothetical protein
MKNFFWVFHELKYWVTVQHYLYVFNSDLNNYYYDCSNCSNADEVGQRVQ